MEKEKILIVHNYYQISGGEDTVVINEKKMLEDYGHKVVLYTRKNSEFKEMNDIQKLCLPLTTIFNPRTYRDVRRIIRIEKIDIVHVHNTLNLISPSVYYAALKENKPVIQTVHNFRLLCPGATFYRDGRICEECIKRGIWCAVKYGCYRGSKWQTLACVINTQIHRIMGIYGKLNYICLTEFTKSKLLTLNQIRENKVSIKPNFVYDSGGKGCPTDYFVFVGRIEEIKGVNVLIEAFKKMPQLKLKIVGTGPLEKDIKQTLAQEKIQNIELLGFKDHEEVNSIICGAKALIMCSQWYETFGMVIVEAYSNGIPVIVGNIGNIKEIVEQDVTGRLFIYDSVDELMNNVKIINNLSDNVMGNNGYAYYKRNFTPDNNYKMLIDIYRNLK